MKRFIPAGLLTLTGAGLLYASLFTELYLRYVRAGMRPLLVASGVVLVVLAVGEAWSWRRREGGEEDREGEGAGHGHDHSTVPRAAWLLLLPALSLLFYAPPALGAYTASHAAPKAVTQQGHFDPLPATSPLPITLTDFTRRVQQDRGQAIKGRSVRMTGLVTPGRSGEDGWYLTRIVISCCAADAQTVKVRIHGVTAPSVNTWVTVTGTWHPGGTLGTSSAAVALDAGSLKKVRRPANGYADALPLPGLGLGESRRVAKAVG
ncbi:TIGR03943 family putative permease subunit [Streptomyces sp. NPDC051636]|uniref:TIGR03943 family putative permease subunit n=1 Tax=Streptomyces sp. NPDC051636 TaxID=3365663 RepID=UPI003798AAC5